MIVGGAPRSDDRGNPSIALLRRASAVDAFENLVAYGQFPTSRSFAVKAQPGDFIGNALRRLGTHTRMRSRTVGLLCALFVLSPVACKREAPTPTAGAATAAPSAAKPTAPSASVIASASSAKKAEPPPAPTSHEIAEVGVVPSWSADAPAAAAARCEGPPAAKGHLAELDRGEAPKIDAGSVDVDALVVELAGSCPDAKRALAISLNTGGMQHYGKKEWRAANRWWRVALAVRPSFVLPRYNLACGLALEGKSKDALRELHELARAAAAGDVDATNYLEKARSDADLVSIRGDAEFEESLAVSKGALVGPRKEPESAAELLALLPRDFRLRLRLDREAAGERVAVAVQVWTWRPGDGSELLVATLATDGRAVDADAEPGNPLGAILVARREGASLKLLRAHRTGEAPPTGLAASGPSLSYRRARACGPGGGALTFKFGYVSLREDACDPSGEAGLRVNGCPNGGTLIEGSCKVACGPDDGCPSDQHCERFWREGATDYATACDE